jgi:hypothetical protein
MNLSVIVDQLNIFWNLFKYGHLFDVNLKFKEYYETGLLNKLVLIKIKAFVLIGTTKGKIAN